MNSLHYQQHEANHRSLNDISTDRHHYAVPRCLNSFRSMNDGGVDMNNKDVGNKHTISKKDKTKKKQHHVAVPHHDDFTTTSSSTKEDTNCGPRDVICGRGKLCPGHEGNKRFREAIDRYVEPYIHANDPDERSAIIKHIIDIITRSGGTFRKKMGYPPRYVPLSYYQAREKVGHALRDTAKTFLKKQQQRDVPKTTISKKSSLDTTVVHGNTSNSSINSNHKLIHHPITISEATNVITDDSYSSTAYENFDVWNDDDDDDIEIYDDGSYPLSIIDNSNTAVVPNDSVRSITSSSQVEQNNTSLSACHVHYYNDHNNEFMMSPHGNCHQGAMIDNHHSDHTHIAMTDRNDVITNQSYCATNNYNDGCYYENNQNISSTIPATWDESNNAVGADHTTNTTVTSPFDEIDEELGDDDGDNNKNYNPTQPDCTVLENKQAALSSVSVGNYFHASACRSFDLSYTSLCSFQFSIQDLDFLVDDDDDDDHNNDNCPIDVVPKNTFEIMNESMMSLCLSIDDIEQQQQPNHHNRILLY